MNKQQFMDLCKNRVIYLDGATGSNLMKAGMPAGICPEKWILEHPDVMQRLQKEYVDAGSDIIYAPTFTSNRIKLEEYGLADEEEQMIHQLVQLSKEAADGRAFVAGDLTMTGRQLAPLGNMNFEYLIDVYKEQIGFLNAAGVDLLVIETMMSLQETRAAVIAAKEICDLPVIVTMTFEKDHRTLFGTDARTAAVVMESLGVAAIGANCSTGPDQMISVIQEMREVCSIPIIAKPNAGMPVLKADGSTGYEMKADEFAHDMLPLLQAGAGIAGGCCGTDPSFIRALKEQVLAAAIGNVRTDSSHRQKMHYLTSERRTIAFHTDSPFLVIGERINPTGKKKLQAELRAGSMELVASFAREQEAHGAAILDVNMGMSGIDEKEMMLKAISEVTMASCLPVSIDSSHVDIIEQALRHYPGRALINSISLETKKCEPLLTLAAKYGAMFILLPLSDDGIPATIEAKNAIISELVNRAQTHGLTTADIIVDGLVMTVGANKNAALETLDTIAFCKSQGLCTTCGLSNISFGLPERSYVNANFLTMAIQRGLTMAIANPSQKNLMCAALSADLLMNKEHADIRFIEYMNLLKEQEEVQKTAELTAMQQAAANPEPHGTERKKTDPTMTGSALSDTGCKTASGQAMEIPEELGDIYQLVLKGRVDAIIIKTKELLQEKVDARWILDRALLPAINEVGELFDIGKYFLPQLISSAEAMKKSIEVLEPVLAEGETAGQEKKTVVIATVQGDIHDIGKNLVALMLKNYGFRVIDLGKDVPKEEIIRVAKEEKADIIALSALMTTTMQQMKQVVELAKKEQVTAKIIIGGAVVTQDYSDEISADGYSSDAAEAVRLVQRLLKMDA